MSSLASHGDLKRFRRSVNHQEVYGGDARHIASRNDPPPNPMYLPEAQVFIRKFADEWFKQKGAVDNNS